MKYSLRSHGSVLASRPMARQVRDQMDAALMGLAESEPVIFDLAGVIALSPSFADELFGRLYSERAAGDGPHCPIALAGVDEDHREVLRAVLVRRKVFAVELRDRQVQLIGAPPHLEETYQVARALHEFRSSELASELGISVPAADNRLALLLKSRILNRKRTAASHGGREFVYTATV